MLVESVSKARKVSDVETGERRLWSGLPSSVETQEVAARDSVLRCIKRWRAGCQLICSASSKR
jgi:hypothetical protein